MEGRLPIYSTPWTRDWAEWVRMAHRVIFPAVSPNMMHEEEKRLLLAFGNSFTAPEECKVEASPNLTLQWTSVCAEEREEGHAPRPDPSNLFLVVASLLPFRLPSHEGFPNYSVSSTALFWENSLCEGGQGLTLRYRAVSLVVWSALATVLRPLRPFKQWKRLRMMMVIFLKFYSTKDSMPWSIMWISQ